MNRRGCLNPYASFSRYTQFRGFGNGVGRALLLCVPSATGASRSDRGCSAAASNNCLERCSVGTERSLSAASARVSAWPWASRVSPCWAVSARARRTSPPPAAKASALPVVYCEANKRSGLSVGHSLIVATKGPEGGSKTHVLPLPPQYSLSKQFERFARTA